ncbi:MAG: hypothetical protein ACRDPY_15240 [Streptosporangiaceae bacterium]
MNIFESLEHDWRKAASHLHHHHGHRAANTQGEPMIDINDLGTKLRDDVEQGKEWLEQVLATHVPAILAFGQQLASSEVGKALIDIGEFALPPEVDTAAANLIRFAAKAAGVTAGTAVSQAPPEPVTTTPAPEPEEPAEAAQPA